MNNKLCIMNTIQLNTIKYNKYKMYSKFTIKFLNIKNKSVLKLLSGNISIFANRYKIIKKAIKLFEQYTSVMINLHS